MLLCSHMMNSDHEEQFVNHKESTSWHFVHFGYFLEHKISHEVPYKDKKKELLIKSCKFKLFILLA